MSDLRLPEIIIRGTAEVINPDDPRHPDYEAWLKEREREKAERMTREAKNGASGQ